MSIDKMVIVAVLCMVGCIARPTVDSHSTTTQIDMVQIKTLREQTERELLSSGIFQSVAWYAHDELEVHDYENGKFVLIAFSGQGSREAAVNMITDAWAVLYRSPRTADQWRSTNLVVGVGRSYSDAVEEARNLLNSI